MKIGLPESYLNYMRNGGRTESFTADEPGYIILWPINDIEQLNADYEIEEFMPGFIGFGSDGGGEMLAFDETGAVYKLPFIGYSTRDDAWRIADNWEQLASRLCD